MKLLLDENLPVRLKYRFSDSLEIRTVTGEGWSGVKDGELLDLLSREGFDGLITADKNLSYQQNLEKRGIVVFLIMTRNNRYEVVKEYVPYLEKQLPPTISHGIIEVYLPE